MERINTAPAVLVIGGMNMDIGGSVSRCMVMRDSNPGIITTRPGGVGRNIAHNLSLLGLRVSLLTAVGGDLHASALTESCGKLGIDLQLTRILPGERSSTYLYVADQSGDMQLGISDMDIVKKIDPTYLQQHMDQINTFDAVVLDANLDTESLSYVAAHCTRPLYADAVSSVKSHRLSGILDKLRAIKPNRLEAQALTGEADMEQAARVLSRQGVTRTFISMGVNGILAMEGEALLQVPCESVSVVNTTGAGDAATAAIVWADLFGMDLQQTAEAAVKAGAITCVSTDANCEQLRTLPALFGL